MKRQPRQTTPGGLTLTRLIVLLLVGILVAIAPPAFAQAAEEEQQQTEESTGQPVIEEIVVTARKTEENVQDVPVAVSVVAGETLVDAAAPDITVLQGYVPNLSIYQGRNQSTTLTAFMRGVGQADPLWGVDPGVGLYLNDVYVARPQGALLDVYDVGRVEVLRGPQGTLYGKNTIGGAIKYVSQAATDEFTGLVSYTGGEFGTQEIKASFSGPIVEGKLRGKVAFASLERDGYGDNVFLDTPVSDKDTRAYRVALDWLPSPDLSVSVDYYDTRDKANPVGLTRLQANPLCFFFLGATCPPYAENFTTESGLEPLNGTDSEGYSLIIDWTINDAWTMRSITAYRESFSRNNIDFDTTPAKIADARSTYHDDQTSQEFNFIYDGGGKLTGVLGLYYFDGEAGGLVQTVFLGSPLIPIPGVNAIYSSTDGLTKTESIAIFGEANYAVSDRMNITFGLRPTREKKNGIAYNTFNLDEDFDQPIFVAADYDKTETFNSLAPRLGFDYAFNRDVMGYFSLSQGFKSGGFNVRAQSTVFPESAEPFDDEVLTVAEVGIKSVLLNRQLVLNAAIFYGDYSDIQVSTFTSYDSNGDGVDDAFYGNFLNAGDATLKGVELEWDFAPPTWIGLSGHLSYLDAKPDHFLDNDGDGFVDTQVITNAPEWTGSVRVNVNFPLLGGALIGNVGYNYRDDSVLTNEGGSYPGRPTEPLLPIVQEAFGTVDAYIGWLSPAAHWRIGVSGRNLTDEAYLTNGYNLPTLGILQGSYGAPRTWLGTVEYRF